MEHDGEQERGKVKTHMKEQCQRAEMAFTVNCDGSGSQDFSDKMNRSDISDERRGRFLASGSRND